MLDSPTLFIVTFYAALAFVATENVNRESLQRVCWMCVIVLWDYLGFY